MNLSNYYIVVLYESCIVQDLKTAIGKTYFWPEKFVCVKKCNNEYINVLTKDKYTDDIPYIGGESFIHPRSKMISLRALLAGKKINSFNFKKVVSFLLADLNRLLSEKKFNFKEKKKQMNMNRYKKEEL